MKATNPTTTTRGKRPKQGKRSAAPNRKAATHESLKPPPPLFEDYDDLEFLLAARAVINMLEEVEMDGSGHSKHRYGCLMAVDILTGQVCKGMSG